MIAHLIRHGDGYAVPIDESILEKLGVDAETQLELFTDGERLVAIPVRGDPRERDEAIAEHARVHGRALKPIA